LEQVDKAPLCPLRPWSMLTFFARLQ